MALLDIELLVAEAAGFADVESRHDEPTLYGVSDGKAVGTYLEQKFSTYVAKKYNFPRGNSALGIDFPSLEVDIKVTSIKQPQSSCPFKSARQKVYGLDYHLMVFVYDKKDDHAFSTARLSILHTIFIDKSRTADFQMTRSIANILENSGNEDDLMALFVEKNLWLDDIQAESLAQEILANPPLEGYLTISNAYQWRLQYRRAISQAGLVEGIRKIR